MENKTEKIKYFTYARKSQEAEDRQVQSIGDQLDTMKDVVDRFDLETVGKPFSEAKSGRKPKMRKAFSQMIERINKGEANGILVWKLNRLSRNQLESGIIGQMLEDRVIKSIRTPEREYKPEDNVLIYNLESAMSVQFSKDLSRDVKRGLKSRVKEGYYPSRSPIGYINDKNIREIVKDPERFDLVRKMWDLALTGRHSQKQITNIANDKWGFTTVKRGKTGGDKISSSQVYKMFGNIFYTGTHFSWNGELHINGKHPQMVTMEEFDRVQKIFRKSNRPRPSKERSPYLGLLRCGCGCDCMFTGEVSVRYCKTANEERTYTHFRSTKRKKDVVCNAKRISLNKLEDQIIETLDKLEIQKPFLDWAFETIDENADNEIFKQVKIEKTKVSSVDKKTNELKNLRHMRVKDFIDDKEFIEEKERIDKEIALLKEYEVKSNNIEQRKEKLKDVFLFLSEAKRKLLKGDNRTKTNILLYFNEEHSIVDGNFIMNTYDWIQPVLTTYKSLEDEYNRLGMGKRHIKQSSKDGFATIRRSWCG